MKIIFNYKYFTIIIILTLFFYLFEIIKFPISNWFFTISIIFLIIKFFRQNTYKSVLNFFWFIKKQIDLKIKNDKKLLTNYSLLGSAFSIILLIFSYNLLSITAKLHLLLLFRISLGLAILIAISLIAYIYSKKILKIFTEEDWKLSKNISLVVLLILIVIGTFLRTWNLENLTPYTDEYPHLIAARDIALGYKHYSEVYDRSLWLVTMPVAEAFSIFEPSLGLARMVGALISLLAILPIFLIAKRVNKSFALIAVALYVLDPLLVGLARNVREYAFYPPIFYFAALAGLKIVDAVRNAKNWQDLKYTLFKRKIILSTIYLLGVLFYSVAIDGLSTMKIIAGLYLTIAFFIIGNLYTKSTNKLLFFFGTLPVLILGLFISHNYPHLTKFIYFNPHLDWHGLRLIFTDLFGMSGLWQTTLLALIWISSILYLIFKPNLTILVIHSTFFIYLYFLIFHFDRNLNLRHAGFLNYWYIFFYGFGLSGLVSLIKGFVKNNLIKIFLIIALFLAILQPWKTVVFVTNQYNGIIPITNIYHDDLKEAASFLYNKASNNHILIGTNLATYMNFYHPSSFAKYVSMFKFDDLDLKKIKIEMDKYGSGWIVIDERRRNWAGLADDEDLENKIIGFKFEKFKINDQFLYFFEEESVGSAALIDERDEAIAD